MTHLRNGDTFACSASGFGIGTTTAWRYVREAVDLLASLADNLQSAVNRAARLAYAVLDGTLIPTDRPADGKPYHSGKHHRHGVNVQVLADPAGRLVWASPALSGATHDLTAARTVALVDALTEISIKTFADKGYQGAGAPFAPLQAASAPSTPVTQPEVGQPGPCPHPRHRRTSRRHAPDVGGPGPSTVLSPPRDQDRPGDPRPSDCPRRPPARMKTLIEDVPAPHQRRTAELPMRRDDQTPVLPPTETLRLARATPAVCSA
ncbi:hypothetical protein Plo01_35420 [Planobispora longispora]|uniref:Transposase n=1 Tax=Planobispora longispora TaxID=28887 RepID=A0A8J3RRT5_9ACTN|nr:hypothetical protein GCM10020093_029450 [Planobispora longispora]GIH77113.1 hypothetical protein Plo01_35420 [Planobispora longispora]